MASAATFDVHRLVSLGRVQTAVPSPDGTWLAVGVARHDPEKAKYVGELWRVPIDGSAAIRLTRGTSHDHAPSFRADGSLGFLSDRPVDGKPDEDAPKPQIWLLPAGGGEPVPLTNEPHGVQAFAFAEKAPVLVALADTIPGVADADQRARGVELKKKGPSVLTYDQAPARHWDHWHGHAVPHVLAFDGNGAGRRDLTPAAVHELRTDATFAVSPDGSTVAIVRAVPGRDRIFDTAFWLVPTSGGPIRTVAADARTTTDRPVWSADGSKLACHRHTRREGAMGPPETGIIDVRSGKFTALTHDGELWLQPHAFTASGALICTADADGAVPVYRIEPTGTIVRLSSVGSGGSHDGLHVVGERIVGLRHRTLHPPEAFVLDDVPDAVPRLISALSGFSEADGAAIARIEPLVVRADDAVDVHSILVVPPGESRGPALLWIHGGPVGQFADGWHWRWNPLIPAAKGYTVALANPRGSTGRGQAFVEGVWGNTWGDRCYRDLMSVTDAFERHPRVDPERIAAMGGSFGGYMANWIGVTTTRFAALVSHASVWSMSSFTGVTDHGAWWCFEMGEAPYGNEERFDRWSPARKAASWKTPTLILHGEKDYRCPIDQGLGLFEALQHHGVPSRLVVFPDEGHWITKPRNIVAWYDEVLGFLDRMLRRRS
jgi:dipeptidyl aminopeptidase/acylaminoacyl peptidase